MLPAPRTPWKDPRVLSILLIVFLAGFVSGVFAMRARSNYRAAAGFPLFKSSMSMSRLQTELSLTPDQALKLKTILDDMVRYKDDLDAEVESYKATGKHKILEILTPDQRARFEELCRNMTDR
jgi:Spy/CpxP family protein refolding chaperone